MAAEKAGVEVTKLPLSYNFVAGGIAGMFVNPPQLPSGRAVYLKKSIWRQAGCSLKNEGMND
jgi:hypothetical protein